MGHAITCGRRNSVVARAPLFGLDQSVSARDCPLRRGDLVGEATAEDDASFRSLEELGFVPNALLIFTELPNE